ncbi:MAG: site-specific integrase [Oligoflexia bacterium]|nr:site-specific integrase [Oligoflexia bacterium]
MGIFGDKFVVELELKGFSNCTKVAYISAMKGFVKFHNKSPNKLGIDEIKKYQHFLIKTKKFSPKTVNQHTSAILFFYRSVMKRYFPVGMIPRMKCQKKIPIVPTADDIEKMLNVWMKIKYRAIFMTLYSTGMRVSEVTNLKPSDIDSKRMIISVRNGKGGKDRQTILSPFLLELLRKYWVSNKEDKSIWLFPNKKNKNKKISTRAVYNLIKKIARLAKINKDISPHSLRHGFAVHLLEGGTNIRYIQSLLGHKEIKSTTIYTYIANVGAMKVKSPIDVILEKTA